MIQLSQPFKRHWPLALALLMSGWFHGAWIDRHGLLGEEARRGLVAQEMIRTGDVLVPREQGKLFLSRPPLQNWCIAAVGLIRGRVDAVAIRLPSVIAVLLTVTMLYLVAHQYLTQAASVLASLGYATMLQVLELGGSGETESIHTFLVAGSILIWHQLWSRDRLTWAWSLGFGLAGLTMLAKGPQGPIYFIASSGAMVLFYKRHREILTPAPWIGLAVFLLVWGAWNVPFTMRFGWRTSVAMLGNDVAMRFVAPTMAQRLTHLATFPAEIAVCWMPWSLLIPLLAWRRCREQIRRIDGLSSLMVLGVVSIAVTFPSVWFVTAAKSRYFLPLAPIGAILAAGCVDACWRIGEPRWWTLAGSWRRMLAGLAGVALTAAIGLPWLNQHQPRWSLNVGELLPVCVMMLTIAAVLIWLIHRGESFATRTVSVFAAAGIMGLLHAMVAMPIVASHSHHADQAIAGLKSRMAAGDHLVSFGLVDAIFVLHYETPIPVINGHQSIGTATTLCYDGKRWPDGLNPDRWTRIAEIRCDKNVHSRSDRQVVVLRRNSVIR